MDRVEESKCPDELYERAQAFLEKVLQVKKGEGRSEGVLELFWDNQFVREIQYFRSALWEGRLTSHLDKTGFLAFFLNQVCQKLDVLSLEDQNELWGKVDACLEQCKQELHIRENERQVLQWLDNIPDDKAYQSEYVEIHSEPLEVGKEAWQSVHNNRSTGNF